MREEDKLLVSLNIRHAHIKHCLFVGVCKIKNCKQTPGDETVRKAKYWKKKTRAENEIRDLKSGKSKLNNKDSKRVKRNLEDARRELRRSDLNILAAEKGLIHSKERYRQLEFELKSIESQLAARAKEPKSWVAEEIQKNRTLGEAAGVPAKYLDDMETCREEGGVISFYFAGFNETTGKYLGLISIDSEGNNRYFRMPQEDLVNMAREMSEAK